LNIKNDFYFLQQNYAEALVLKLDFWGKMNFMVFLFAPNAAMGHLLFVLGHLHV